MITGAEDHAHWANGQLWPDPARYSRDGSAPPRPTTRRDRWNQPPRDKTRPEGRAGDDMSAEAIATVGVGGALMAVLVPLLLAQGRRLDRVETRIERIEDTLHGLAERVARIEGALTGPWRPPANGGSAAAPPVTNGIRPQRPTHNPPARDGCRRGAVLVDADLAGADVTDVISGKLCATRIMKAHVT